VGDIFFFIQMEGKTDGQTEREQDNRLFFTFSKAPKIYSIAK